MSGHQKGIIIPNKADRSRILDYINKYSYYKYTCNERGEIKRDGNKKNGFFGFGKSKSYSAVLDLAINTPDRIFINIDYTIVEYHNGKKYEYKVDSDAGGGVTNFSLSPPDIYITITGEESYYDILLENMQLVRYSPEEILLHELVGHAIPAKLKKTKGSAIKNENVVREELNLEKRKDTDNDSVVSHNATDYELFEN